MSRRVKLIVHLAIISILTAAIITKSLPVAVLAVIVTSMNLGILIGEKLAKDKV